MSQVLEVVTVMIAFHGRAPSAPLATWAAAVVPISIVRIALARRVLARPPTMPLKYLRAYAAIVGLSGMHWGCAVWLYLTPQDPAQFAVTCLVICCLLVGSTMSLSVYLPAFFCFNLPAVAVATAGMARTGGVMWAGVAMVLPYIVTSTVFARRQEQSLVEAIRVRVENEELALSLAEEKHAANEARARAEQANRAKSVLLSGASHDLRQPIHAQPLYMQVLETEVTSTGGKDTLRRLLGVWDTGVGIAAAEHENVFCEYVQLTTPTRDQSRGLARLPIRLQGAAVKSVQGDASRKGTVCSTWGSALRSDR